MRLKLIHELDVKDTNKEQLIDVHNSLNSLFPEKEGLCWPKMSTLKFIISGFNSGEIFIFTKRVFFSSSNEKNADKKLTKFKLVCLTKCILDTTIAAINDMWQDTKNCENSPIVEVVFSFHPINSACSKK